MASEAGGPLPHDRQAELAVLGAMLIDPTCVDLVAARLEPEAFYLLRHREVFQAMFRLAQSAKGLDPVLLKHELARDGKVRAPEGIARLLAELMDAVPCSANVEHYCAVVAEQAQLRRIAELRRSLTDALRPGTQADDLLSEIERFSRENVALVGDSIPPIEQHVDEAARLLQERAEGRTVAIQTGILPLDRATGGLERGLLTILGGYSGDGKTSLAENIIAYACVGHGHPTLFFSAEMPGPMIVACLQRILTGIDDTDVAKGSFLPADYRLWTEAAARIRRAPLFIDDTGDIAISAVRAKTEREAKRHAVELVIVDFIQLLRPERSAKRNVEVAEIGRELKALARRTGAHVLALSQLRRITKDDPARDFSWSSELRQAADIAILLGRDKEYRFGGDSEPDVAQRRVTIAKQRLRGEAGFFLTFHRPTLTFSREAHPEGEHRGPGRERFAGSGDGGRNGPQGTPRTIDYAASRHPAAGQDHRGADEAQQDALPF